MALLLQAASAFLNIFGLVELTKTFIVVIMGLIVFGVGVNMLVNRR